MNRMPLVRAVIGALFTVAAATPALAQDLVSTRLVSAKLATDAALDRQPAQLAWALEATPLAAPAPLTESREFTTELDAETLAKGWRLPVASPGAVVRITPVGADGAAQHGGLSIDALTLLQGASMSKLRDVSAHVADAADLAQTGLGFPDGSVAFKLKPTLGSSELVLALAEPKAARYLVHVFEPDSGDVLELRAESAALLSGQVAPAQVRWRCDAKRAVGRVSGLLVSPDGRTEPVEFAKASNGAWATRIAPQAIAANAGQGLFELHVFASDAKGEVQRDAKLAFAVALPRARSEGRPTLRTTSDGSVEVRVPLQVASASRYDASVVLQATNADGRLVPAAIAHAGAWLEPGQRALSLRFEPALLSGRGLGAPYALGPLTLTDQGQLAVIERRAQP